MTNLAKVIAYVLAIVTTGKEYEVLEVIKSFPHVTEAIAVFGEFDVAIRLEADSLSDIDSIVTRIRSIPEVKRTVTLVGSKAA